MIASFGRSGSSDEASVAVFAKATCGLEADAMTEPKRTDAELCNHERRVDGTSALREVEDERAAVLLQPVLKAPTTPSADDSSSVVRGIFMVE